MCNQSTGIDILLGCIVMKHKNVRTAQTRNQERNTRAQHEREYIQRSLSRLTTQANQAIWDTFGTLRGVAPKTQADKENPQVAHMVYHYTVDLAYKMDELERGPEYRTAKVIGEIESIIEDIVRLAAPTTE